MEMSDLEPLLGRTLVIVAHPDDECIAFGALLQRVAHATVVYCTDGAPLDPYFWQQRYGSREKYAELRREETRRALNTVGITEIRFLADDPEARGQFVDQELYRALPLAYRLLGQIIAIERPTALLTLAYEGGHPDHDSCNLLTSQLAAEAGIPAYEAPLYHRAGWTGEGINRRGLQRFVHDSDDEVDIAPTEVELQRKRTMCEQYPSQGDFLGFFDIRREIVRPLATYDYSLPPHEGALNYEAWQWRMTGRDVCVAFMDFRQALVQQAI
jgi:LmbE family N-acetylglucosaminyl deacetylase